MILTGKAKDDFEKWYFENHCSSSLKFDELLPHHREEIFGWLYTKAGDIVLFSFILDWLDSVSIHVGVFPYLELMKGGKNANVFRVYLCYSLHSVWANRQEATRAAIESANEIYNNQK